MAATLKDIAERASVTEAAVSYALNNSHEVSENTKQKVLRIAKELDYHPNIIAKGLVLNKTHNIGAALYSIDYLMTLYFTTIIGGIAHQVGLHNYNLQFKVTNLIGESAKNLYFIKKVKEKSVDGIIIVDQIVPDSEIINLKDMNIPFVLVDRYIPSMDTFCVRVDNRKGIYLAAEYLIKKGHRRIAFVNEGMKFSKIIDMFEGYCKALKDYNIPIDRELIVDAKGMDVDNIDSTSLENILGIDSPATAILCSCDIFAAKILKVLREKKINVPNDIALVGYNDDPSIAYLEPQLTTVHVPLREMGEESARMLFSLIDGMIPEKSEAIFEPNLIVRQST